MDNCPIFSCFTGASFALAEMFFGTHSLSPLGRAENARIRRKL